MDISSYVDRYYGFISATGWVLLAGATLLALTYVAFAFHGLRTKTWKMGTVFAGAVVLGAAVFLGSVIAVATVDAYHLALSKRVATEANNTYGTDLTGDLVQSAWRAGSDQVRFTGESRDGDVVVTGIKVDGAAKTLTVYTADATVKEPLN